MGQGKKNVTGCRHKAQKRHSPTKLRARKARNRLS
jgi:hypothetical protein